MSRNWIAPSLVALLAVVGCGQTNRLDEARDPAPPVEDHQATAPDNLYGEPAVGQDDQVVFDDDTKIAPQHVLRPDIDGEEIEPLDAEELSLEGVTTPQSTPARQDTGSDAIEESLLDKEQIDSQDLEDRFDRALDLDEPPPADIPSETTETLRPEDRPIRDEPVTATPVLDQEELGEEIAPQVPQDATDEAEHEQASAETGEDDQASTDLITRAVAKANDEIGEAAKTLEERIEETLEEAAPQQPADETPPSLPLEDPDAATEPESSAIDQFAPADDDAPATDPQEIEARKPLLDVQPAAAGGDEVFTARALVAADGDELDGEAADSEIKKVERELAAMRKSLTQQRMVVGEAAVHLNSLQHNLQLLRDAESEDRLTHEAAVKSAAVALEYSLRKARQAFPELDMEPAADDTPESATQAEAEPSSP